VSVVAPSALLAGSLTTLALLRGDGAAAWLAAHGAEVSHWLVIRDIGSGLVIDKHGDFISHADFR
jgi:hypothetical protein